MSLYNIAMIIAHPDDEAFLAAVTLNRAASQGHRVSALLATYGDAGKSGRMGPMSREHLVEQRKKEYASASQIIGIEHTRYLGLQDGKLKDIGIELLTEDVVTFLNEEKPQVVLTFPEDGISGHADHTAVCLAATAAIHSGRCPSVQKLYYFSSSALKEKGHKPSVSVDTSLNITVKKNSLLAYESQILSIEKVFGQLQNPEVEIKPSMKYEEFVLVWKRGETYPEITENELTDDILITP
jgi:LmbE family N-acetylglucosaminyl deacetylase